MSGKTLVYGKNNVEIMLALGLGDKILMTADCSSVLPEYQEEFEKIPRVKDYQEVRYFVKEFALSLEPDMVIGWRSLFDMEDRMGDVGFWHERSIGTYTSINNGRIYCVCLRLDRICRADHLPHCPAENSSV